MTAVLLIHNFTVLLTKMVARTRNAVVRVLRENLLHQMQRRKFWRYKGPHCKCLGFGVQTLLFIDTKS